MAPNGTRKRRIRTIVYAIVVLAVAGGVTYYFTLGKVPTLALVKPTRGPAVDAVYATGAVEPVYWAKISSTVQGRIVAINFKDNDFVKRGDVLARLDDREARARLAQLVAQEKFLQQELVRISKLVETRVASQQALQRVSSQHAAAVAATKAARQRLTDLTIRSPLDGQVLRQDGNIGEVVKAGQILFWVGKCCPKRIEAEVDEEDIPLVKPGQNVLVKADAFPGKAFGATVTSITPKGDPVSKNYRVRITLKPKSPLRIGMTTEVNIIIKKVDNALLVPRSAVVGDAVWTVVGGRARRRTVVRGIAGEERVQIVKGLGDTDLVIANPPEGLAEGDRVRAAKKPKG